MVVFQVVRGRSGHRIRKVTVVREEETHLVKAGPIVFANLPKATTFLRRNDAQACLAAIEAGNLQAP